MLGIPLWRVLVICAASLGALWLAPRNGPLEPGLIGLVILTLGIGLNLRPSPAKRIQSGIPAAGQLNSDDAAERTAGIYALERTAEEDPSRRQEVVDLLCKYLSRSERSKDDLHVRHLAQETIIAHLRATPGSQGERFWPGIDLELSGATLHDWDMADCHVRRASFKRARFDGPASFNGTRFDDGTTFVGARFGDGALFDGTNFNADITFNNAGFSAEASFNGAHFGGGTWFAYMTFGGMATFDNTRFDRRTAFDRTRFGEASFDDALFSRISFDRARFERVSFDRAHFLEQSSFGAANFSGEATFDDVHFDGKAVFVKTCFNGEATFNGVRFHGGTSFFGTRFAGTPAFHGARAGDERFDHESALKLARFRQ